MHALGSGFWVCKVYVSSKYLLDELNARKQVHSKIDELPDNALLFVLFLLQHKHVVVEELLQLLVGEVDAKLLESVVLRELVNKEVISELYTRRVTIHTPTRTDMRNYDNKQLGLLFKEGERQKYKINKTTVERTKFTSPRGEGIQSRD